MTLLLWWHASQWQPRRTDPVNYYDGPIVSQTVTRTVTDIIVLVLCTQPITDPSDPGIQPIVVLLWAQ